MNVGQIIAWLVCLVLAFFACIVSIHNLGQNNILRQQVDDLQTNRPALKTMNAELKKIRTTLQDIEQELSGETDVERNGEAGSKK